MHSASQSLNDERGQMSEVVFKAMHGNSPVTLCIGVWQLCAVIGLAVVAVTMFYHIKTVKLRLSAGMMDVRWVA